jgi:hypothetical protein
VRNSGRRFDATGGGDVDDHSAVGHPAGCLLTANEVAAHVDGHHPIPFGVVKVEHWRARVDACVVDPDVDAAHELDGSIGELR